MSNNPQFLIIAGPNGAGKSTFSKKLSKPGAVIFDVDKVIARIKAQTTGKTKKQISEESTREFKKYPTELSFRITIPGKIRRPV